MNIKELAQLQKTVEGLRDLRLETPCPDCDNPFMQLATIHGIDQIDQLSPVRLMELDRVFEFDVSLACCGCGTVFGITSVLEHAAEGVSA